MCVVATNWDGEKENTVFSFYAKRTNFAGLLCDLWIIDSNNSSEQAFLSLLSFAMHIRIQQEMHQKNNWLQTRDDYRFTYKMDGDGWTNAKHILNDNE